MATAPVELKDVQGVAFYAYSEHPFARYLLLTLVKDDPRTYKWLHDLKVRTAHEAHNEGRKRTATEGVQVAFTVHGLMTFGLSRDDLKEFPREFLLGMNNATQARIMRDTPHTWTFGAHAQAPIHAVLMLFAQTEPALAALVAHHRAELAAAGAIVAHEDEGRILAESREHFGFHDGISEPRVEGGPRTKHATRSSIPAGELLLGYENAYSETTQSPVVRGFDLGKNGTFVVYRKFRQDVTRFWNEMRAQARPRGAETQEEAAIRLAASMVGRWPGGGSLAKYPHADPGFTSDNDFFYAREDPHGYKCPFGSHARRTNPRDMLPPGRSESLTQTSRHRLVRRGRPYGKERPQPWKYTTDDGVERGLIFIAMCASLRRQFEFIQQTWVNSTKFAGLYDERDPILGALPGETAPYTLQAEPVRRRLVGLPSFIEMLGGAYFFLPGLRAIDWLATPPVGRASLR